MSAAKPLGPCPTLSPYYPLHHTSHSARLEASKALMEFGFQLIALAVLAALQADADGPAKDGEHEQPWQRLDELLQRLLSHTADGANDDAADGPAFQTRAWKPKLPTAQFHAHHGDGGAPRYGKRNGEECLEPPKPRRTSPPEVTHAQTKPQVHKPTDVPAHLQLHKPADLPSSEAVRKPQKGQLPPEPTGTVHVGKPIIVKAGEVFDGKGKYYRPTSALGDGGQGEKQLPVFILEPGATLKNVQLSGADGIHLLHDARLDNVVNRDVGEDAITIDGEGNRRHDARLAGYAFDKIPSRRPRVEIVNSAFYGAHDKLIQANGDADVSLKGVYVNGAGKVFRTNGGKDIEAHVHIEDSVFENIKEAIFRTDSARSTVSLRRVDSTDTPFDALAPDRRQASGAGRVSYKPYSG